jgi:hypothetical protein
MTFFQTKNETHRIGTLDLQLGCVHSWITLLQWCPVSPRTKWLWPPIIASKSTVESCRRRSNRLLPIFPTSLQTQKLSIEESWMRASRIDGPKWYIKLYMLMPMKSSCSTSRTWIYITILPYNIRSRLSSDNLNNCSFGFENDNTRT